MRTYKSEKNITRFTYAKTAFQGWRLRIERRGVSFMRYFSDKEYGGPAEARDAARDAKDCILDVVAKRRRTSDGNLTRTCIKECEGIMKSY